MSETFGIARSKANQLGRTTSDQTGAVPKFEWISKLEETLAAEAFQQKEKKDFDLFEKLVLLLKEIDLGDVSGFQDIEKDLGVREPFRALRKTVLNEQWLRNSGLVGAMLLNSGCGAVCSSLL